MSDETQVIDPVVEPIVEPGTPLEPEPEATPGLEVPSAPATEPETPTV